MEPKTSVKTRATRIIAIDFGLARLGVAISDEMKIIAMPLMTITCESKSDKTVAKVLDELAKHQVANKYDLEAIILGMPLMMSGKMGMLADEVKHFVDVLRQSTSTPIITWDERLTTVQAERSMKEGTMSRKKRSKIVDKVAAVIILQSYLDYLGMCR